MKFFKVNKLSKRTFVGGLLAFGLGTSQLATQALASGYEPISGIDIIIRKDPSLEALKPLSFGQKEIGLTSMDSYDKLNRRIKELILAAQKRNDVDTKYIRGKKEVLSKKLFSKLQKGKGGTEIIRYAQAGCCKVTLTIKITFGKK